MLGCLLGMLSASPAYYILNFASKFGCLFTTPAIFGFAPVCVSTLFSAQNCAGHVILSYYNCTSRGKTFLQPLLQLPLLAIAKNTLVHAFAARCAIIANTCFLCGPVPRLLYLCILVILERSAYPKVTRLHTRIILACDWNIQGLQRASVTPIHLRHTVCALFW